MAGVAVRAALAFVDPQVFRQIEQYGATEETGFRRSGATTDPRVAGLEVRYKFGG